MERTGGKDLVVSDNRLSMDVGRDALGCVGGQRFHDPRLLPDSRVRIELYQCQEGYSGRADREDRS